ncbi:anti-phage dCTP deaminase [Hoyosella sp. YIM 151337]|uniref:anti-phage dCTP deaminase n=1 Tax=Hoyosella sp. YIM 151337 TaxID=2992742 RepID=UPI002235BF2E|nr:anti-phage dCTP deaminase [Hoyosella sp. YIM 151337]MCW4353435.1 anti-phage dCTP deaminase [Hoyosella sp. YIM 151337]
MSEVATGLFSGVEISRGEVVIGLVGAIGTRLQDVEVRLMRALMGVGYSTETVRVSALIAEATQARASDLPENPTTELDGLMDRGDFLRERIGHGGAAAALAVTEIAAQRNGDRSGDDRASERVGVATIIRQLKHPEEVRLLRSVYGPRFILVGAWSPVSERRKAMLEFLREREPGHNDGWYNDNADQLINRDEKDSAKKLGQRVRHTFELADAFVALLPGQDTDQQISRIVDLLFGSPFVTPTQDEIAMAHASAASLRSSDAGRQVGAVVMDAQGEVLVTGVNEVPKPGGGQYWPGDTPDHRDFQSGYDVNERLKLVLITDILAKLREDGSWLSPECESEDLGQLAHRAIFNGPLSDSRVGDLLEFGRVAHAEMAAICTAARRGTPIGGQTMYSTTYPCHECARLIIACGIRRVVYIDPYPKSQVPEMYRHQVTEGSSGVACGSGTVVFEPFRGIAPRLYRSVFAMADRGREEMTGQYAQWNASTAPPRLVADAEAIPPLQEMEDSVINRMREAMIREGFIADPTDEEVTQEAKEAAESHSDAPPRGGDR